MQSKFSEKVKSYVGESGKQALVGTYKGLLKF